MATKQEIKQSLIQSLNDEVWQKAKNSLVGQELISWGTEVIYAVQNQRQAIENMFSESLIQIQDVIRLSNTSIPTVQISNPSFITLNKTLMNQLVNDELSHQSVFDIFSLKLSIGSSTFFNVDYLSFDDTDPSNVVASDTKFVQGIPTCVYYQPQNPIISVSKTYQNYNRVVVNNLEHTNNDNGLYSNYINIGSDVLVDSIQVWCFVNGAIYLFHKFDPLEVSPVARHYRIYINPSGEYNIIFGNGQNGWFVSDTNEVFVTFLKLTSNAFSISEGSALRLEYNNNSINISEPTYSFSNIYQYYADKFIDLERMHADLLGKVASRNSLYTEKDFKNYLNSFAEIYDTSIYFDNQNRRVECSVLTATQFEDLSYIAYLLVDRVSFLFECTLKIVPHNNYNISIEYPQDVNVLSDIENYLTEYYSIENLKFGQRISANDIYNVIYQRFGIQVNYSSILITDGGGVPVPEDVEVSISNCPIFSVN